MPLVIQGKTYAVPGEGNQPNITGKEMTGIEDYYGLDGFRLLGVLAGDTKEVKGYTQTKALYALAWVCMNRAGDVVSMDNVLDMPLTDIQVVDDENPIQAAD